IVAAFADALAPTFASLRCSESASAAWRLREKFPASSKQAGRSYRKIMQTDPIGDFLTRIRNAAAAKHQRVDVPVSKLKTEIARILKEEGYISTFKLVDENKTRKMLRVFLKYTPDRRSVITGVKRISRPGRLAHIGAADIRPVVGGMG